MGLQIESGSGNGQQVSVTRNRLDVASKTNGRATYVSKEDGQCFFWGHAYDYDAGDTILWISNTSTTKNLNIEKVNIASDTATQYTVHSPAYTTPAGTEVTGVNGNRTSGNSADAECYGDETNNTQANVLKQGILGANGEKGCPVDGKLILGYHDTLAIDFVTAGGLGSASISAYFEDKDA